MDLRACGPRLILMFGEPSGAVELLAERYGAAGALDGLGLTEIFGIGGNCPYTRDIHVSEDSLLVECLRLDADKPVPPGDLGELTYTNLVDDTQPLLRYRSGDLGVLSDGSPCACGSTQPRIVGSVRGRVDDMIWYRGANIFPSAVEAAVRATPGLGAEFQLVITEKAGVPALTVRVEARDPADEALADATAEAVRMAIRESVTVELLPPGTLPRPDGRRKARRLVDLRG